MFMTGYMPVRVKAKDKMKQIKLWVPMERKEPEMLTSIFIFVTSFVINLLIY
jgi:hypothetical protein